MWIAVKTLNVVANLPHRSHNTIEWIVFWIVNRCLTRLIHSICEINKRSNSDVSSPRQMFRTVGTLDRVGITTVSRSGVVHRLRWLVEAERKG